MSTNAEAITSVSTFNSLNREQAERELLTCCRASHWTAAVAAGRPYGSLAALLAMSDTVFATLSEADIAEALGAHPRIGERASGSGRDAGWSRREQSGASTATPKLQQALADANAAYEQRFDRVFLICASGLSAAEMLAALRGRLGNDDQTEQAVVREELRKITRLRLTKLFS